MGAWSTTCRDCGHRYTYDGAPTPVPDCPKCTRRLNSRRPVPLQQESEDFLAFCDEVIEDIDKLPTRADEFAESVREKVRGIANTVAERGEVTLAQRQAVENMHAAVRRWLDH